MLPLFLSIEGLYSYQEKQEIDFSILTEAGLFGIFGNVGSGKSSILEAISFALYGETERLNNKEKRAYNMLNLKSNSACIVFEFLNFENRKFRMVAQWKRKKRFEETTTLERHAYAWSPEGWIPLTSNDGSLLTQLSYDNFRRTIIIPQGQFKEFLELKGKDRSEMMKELFHLDRFDLGPKVATLQRANNSRMEHLRGALSGFESISSATLTQKNEELLTAGGQLQGVREAYNRLEQQHKILLEAKAFHMELASKKQEYQALQLQEPKIRQQEQELIRYEQTARAFRELLNSTQAFNKDKEKLTFKIENLSAKRIQAHQELRLKEDALAQTMQIFNQLDTFRAEIDDIRLLAEIQENSAEKEELSKRLERGQPHLEKEQQQQQLLNSELASKETLLDEIKNKKIDTISLMAIENWYQQQDNWQQHYAQHERASAQLQQEQQHIAQEFEQQNLTLSSWEAQSAQRLEELQQERQTMQQQETQLRVQLKLAEFADNLRPGEGCPLCGALEHPHPMVATDLHRQAQTLKEQQAQVQQALMEQQNLINSYMRWATTYADKEQQRQQLQLQLGELSTRLQEHQAAFAWPHFDQHDKRAFEAYKAENLMAEALVKQTETDIKDIRTAQQETAQKIEKYQLTIAAIHQNIALKEGIIARHESRLQLLTDTSARQLTRQDLQQKQELLLQTIVDTEQRYRQLTEDITTVKTELARINGQRLEAKEQFQQIIIELTSRQAEIATLLTQHGYNDIIAVQQVIHKNLPVDKIRSDIQAFDTAKSIVMSRMDLLVAQTSAYPYVEETFIALADTLQIKQEELELQLSVYGAMEQELSRLQAEFQKKEKLMEAYELLDLRKTNLTTLDNLFRGAGFVNYVSSIHLARLCEIANQRFHRLTKNQLSLTINENNEFEVIDFLHNGYHRSVKTLSGGQSFQASLCLALALAENIQSMNKSDKNFFFIDEGFGTQDKESINTVFETLQYLHQENRVVGIISHVEELKERIPRAVSVTKDVERGSMITYV